jgi:DNA-binding transcriptional regulator YiaG
MTREAHRLEVADWIRTERSELALKQLAVAAAVGTTVATLSRWESGENPPGIYSYRMLRRYFKQQREQQAAANAKAVQA